MEQFTTSTNGVDACAEAGGEVPEVKVSAEPDVERSSPVPPPPVLEEEEEEGGVPPPEQERSSPSRDSKSSTPTGWASGDDDGTKTG